MKLIALGSGGWFPSPLRHTCTYILSTDQHLILIDTGSGITRLMDYTWLLDRYDTLHIIYTHYHHDHVAGLGYLPHFAGDKKLVIKGPGKPYYSQSCEDILSTYTRTPFFPKSIHNFTPEVDISDYDESGFEIAGMEVTVLQQVHADHSFGLQFGDQLYFATDTEPLEETFRRAAHTKVLVHECWGTEGELPGHSSAIAIRQYLQSYPVDRTFLIHAHPSWRCEETAAIEDVFSAEMQVAYMMDGMNIHI